MKGERRNKEIKRQRRETSTFFPSLLFEREGSNFIVGVRREGERSYGRQRAVKLREREGERRERERREEEEIATATNATTVAAAAKADALQRQQHLQQQQSNCRLMQQQLQKKQFGIILLGPPARKKS